MLPPSMSWPRTRRVEADGDRVAGGKGVLQRLVEKAVKTPRGCLLPGLAAGTGCVDRRGGVYRALTAARARHALTLGRTLLHSDCSADSRPILARSGLTKVTTTTPYVWRR